MKTTLNIDERIFRAAKKLAAERGVTLTQVVEEALREAVLPPRSRARPFRFSLPTVKGRHPPPVDVADRAALHDRMETDR